MSEIPESTVESNFESSNSEKPNGGENSSDTTSGGDAASQNPLKMRIDPLQLLNCLSILLDSKGAIKSIEEVQRVAGLMGKYSKKLVSKCIYLNILQATDLPLLDEFYKETGWNLVFAWLTEAVNTANYPLAQQILTLLQGSPVSIERLKRNSMPKIVKDLSKDCPHAGAREVAEMVVQRWKDLVKVCTPNASSSSSALNSVAESNSPSVTDVSENDKRHVTDSTETEMDSVTHSKELAISTNLQGTDADLKSETKETLMNTSHSDVINLDTDSQESKQDTEAEEEIITTPSRRRGRGRGSSAKRGVSRGRGRPRRGTGTGRGRGKSRKITYAELLRQDIGSPDDISKTEDGDDSVPPLRIAIRNGVKVVPSDRVKRKRLSVESTDSEDNKTLSKIKEECNNVSLNDEDEEESLIIKRKKSKRLVIDDASDEEMQDEKDSSKTEAKIETKKLKDKKVIRKGRKIEKSEAKNKSESKEKKDTKIDNNKEKKQDKLEKEQDAKITKKHSNRDKEKESSSKHKERDRDKREKDRHRHRSNSSKDSEKDRDKNRHRDKYRDKDRHREKDKERDKNVKDRHHEKDNDKGEEQAEKDKATLDKVKPLSIQGLAKIPRKPATAPKSSPQQPVSFMDALGSADSDATEVKRSTVVKTKSSNPRPTGLFEEAIKPPGIAGKRSTDAVKRQNSSSSLPYVGDNSKTTKASPSSVPPVGDRPGGVKLISPKRHMIAEDGGFMAAIKAAERKKIVRKRKSSDSDPNKPDISSPKATKSEKDESSEEPLKSDGETPVTATIEDENENKTEPEPVLSPTSIKPILNFYKETLTDEPEVKEETPEKEASPDPEENEEEKKEEEENENEKIEEPMDTNEDLDFRQPSSPTCDNMDIDDLDDNERKSPLDSSLPAPANEEYEKINVVFTPVTNLKGVLVYHRPFNRPKKDVKWKQEDKLKEIFYFPMDETERVNVNTIKFAEMMMQEKAGEKEMFGRNKGVSRSLADNFGFEDSFQDSSIEYMPYKLYPVHLNEPPKVTPGYKSIERHVQSKREHETMAAFFHPAMLPDSPLEPTPELVPRKDPVIIPINDVSGSDSFTDNRKFPWPEPVFNPPEFPYMAGAASHQGQPQHPGGGHWVMGNQAMNRFPAPGGAGGGGGAMFGSSNGPQGPMGSQGGLFPQGPQGFRGDRGHWAGPNEFGGPQMLMPNGPMGMPNMGMNPNSGMQPGPGMGMPMGGMGMGSGPPMNNRENFPRFRRNPGGIRGGRGPMPVCKHFRFGNCRNGNECPFTHTR